MIDWSPAQWIEFLQGIKNLGWAVLGVLTLTTWIFIWCKYKRKSPPEN